LEEGNLLTRCREASLRPEGASLGRPLIVELLEIISNQGLLKSEKCFNLEEMIEGHQTNLSKIFQRRNLIEETLIVAAEQGKMTRNSVLKQMLGLVTIET
jgi:hypothetical protein